MSIRVATFGITDLRLASRVDKVDLSAARTIAGQSGQVRGHWDAVCIRIPTSGISGNVAYNLLGHDSGDALFGGTSPGDGRLRFGGTGLSTAAERLKVWSSWRQGANFAVLPTAFTATDPLVTGAGTAQFIVRGIRNIGTAISPSWVGFVAVCPVNGGTPTCQVQTLANISYIAGAGAIISQIFVAQSVNNTRWTPAGVCLERYGLMEGDFPWDTANDAGVTGAGRPHLDAVRALANGAGAIDVHTYASMAAAQLAGTLPYDNLDTGLSEVRLYYPLTGLNAAGLENQGSAGVNTLTVTPQNGSSTAGLVDESDLAPSHWTGFAPVIAEPRMRDFGGGGTLPVTIRGTHTGDVQRRWVLKGTSTVVPGFDWALRTNTGGNWQTSDVLPPGNFTLEVRDATNNALLSTLTDILVGVKILLHGQSGMYRSFLSPGQANQLGIAVAAGAQGSFCTISPDNAGGSSYSKPGLNRVRLEGGVASTASYGAILMLNERHAMNPGVPLIIELAAISGTNMETEWAADAAYGQWSYLGDVVEPGASNANGAGVMGFWAWLNSEQIDGHILMWHPNIAAAETGENSRQAYIDAINFRFASSPNAPWAILPSWRCHSDEIGGNTILKRQDHVLMANQLGAAGVLGPHWPDVVSDGNPNPGSLHPAYVGAAVTDTQQVGAARTTRGMGRVAARLFNQEINTTFHIAGAWWTDNLNRNQINVELGRKARTLAGADIALSVIWISTDNGSTWTNTGFTAAFDATATRLVITKDSGVWSGTVRVDYARHWPFGPSVTPDPDNENDNIARLNGLIYDAGTWRGRTDLGAGAAGNVLQGTNRTGAGVAGIAVTARGQPAIVATERMRGDRTVTVRMRRVGTNELLDEQTIVLPTTDAFPPAAPLATGAFSVGADGVTFAGVAA